MTIPGRLSSGELFYVGEQCLKITGAYVPDLIDEESRGSADATLGCAQNVFVHAKGMRVQHHVEIEALHVEPNLSGV
jgi:hypothetical protein